MADISPLDRRNQIVAGESGSFGGRKSTASRTSTSTSTRTIAKFRDLGLARLERSSSGNFGYEAGGALGAGGGQRSKDLPGSRAFLGFVTFWLRSPSSSGSSSASSLACRSAASSKRSGSSRRHRVRIATVAFMHKAAL